MRKNIIYIKNNILALIICILWWFPVTYFGYWTAPVGTDYFRAIKIPFIGLLFIFIIIKKVNSVNWRVLLFLLIAFIASLDSSDMEYSVVKFLILAVTLSVFSPLVSSMNARIIRASIWQNLCWSAVFVALLSIIWWLANLPVPILYAKEGFPGITSHAMLLGPVAGIGSIFLLSKAFSENKYWLTTLAILCYIVSFASASRAAIAGTTIGFCLILMVGLNRGKILSLVRLIFPLISIFVFLILVFPEEKLFFDFLKVDDLRNKGFSHSRKQLWEERMTEFREKPIVGVGIGMSFGYENALSKGFGEKFTGTVEPGSAYLVVLSMTGLLGAISFIILIGYEMLSLRKYWEFIEFKRKHEIIGIGSLLFVHAIAEGWIFSPGNVLCLFFWLWLGIVRDSSDVVRLNMNHLKTLKIRL